VSFSKIGCIGLVTLDQVLYALRHGKNAVACMYFAVSVAVSALFIKWAHRLLYQSSHGRPVKLNDFFFA
jgi:hypothetical protein